MAYFNPANAYSGYSGAGAQGAQGAQGATGLNGTNGAQGNQGATGTSGYSGFSGAVGATGAQGAQGFQGNQGATGAQGAQGFQGNQGATGSTGAQGASGYSGFSGISGYSGLKGSTGSTGAQGAQGAQGAAGTNGAQGAQGFQGNQGATGSTGAQGASGYSGFSGAFAGTGTTNYISKFTGASSLGNSIAYDNGSQIGVNTTAPSATLTISGTLSSSQSFWVGPNFYVTTAGNATGVSFTSTSSRTGKTNIRPLVTLVADPLATTKLLNAVVYDSLLDGSTNEIGFIAEDVQSVLPSVVDAAADGTVIGIDYGRITALLTEAVKALSTKVDALNAKVGL